MHSLAILLFILLFIQWAHELDEEHAVAAFIKNHDETGDVLPKICEDTGDHKPSAVAMRYIKIPAVNSLSPCC